MLFPVFRADPAQAVGLYYIFYMVVVSFFMLNIFIGYVIVTFRDTVDDAFKGCPFGKNQRKCLSYVISAKPPRLHRWSEPNPVF